MLPLMIFQPKSCFMHQSHAFVYLKKQFLSLSLFLADLCLTFAHCVFPQLSCWMGPIQSSGMIVSHHLGVCSWRQLIYLICNSVFEGVSESFKCGMVYVHISIYANTYIPLHIAYMQQMWSSYYSNFGQYLLTSENEIVKALVFHFGTA